MRLLFAWYRFTVHGAIGRAINIAKTFALAGVETQALAESWDAALVPGAGSSGEQLVLLKILTHSQFGTRVQLVLNDPSYYERFEFANRMLDPHIVIFNSSHWRPQDFRKMSAEAFHILPGAIDTDIFNPGEPIAARKPGPPWNIGAFSIKNPDPLLDAVGLLPPDYVIHFYGNVPPESAERLSRLAAEGRVVHHGKLFGNDLADFYRSMHVVVTTELSAGWCNTAAEACACGVPCVVTPHGTIDFARNGENALVMEAPTPEAIAESVIRLTSDQDLAAELGRNAAATMKDFSWKKYCEELFSIIQQPRIPSYYRIPSIGLYGKWEPEVRLGGLEPVLDACKGLTLLDLGAAEGVISFYFARNGVKLVHGFEFVAERVQAANQILSHVEGVDFAFRQADLSEWKVLEQQYGDLLLEKYDIILFLGLYHHLPDAARDRFLREALKRCRLWFAVRLPAALAREKALAHAVADAGFELVSEREADEEENIGWLGIFRRVADK